MSFINLSLLTVIFVILLMIVRSIKGELALPLSICISVALTGAAISAVTPIIEYIGSILSVHSKEYIVLLIKALGISIVTGTASDICHDCGENAIASKLELLGKCEMLLLAFPIVKEILSLISEVLEA